MKIIAALAWYTEPPAFLHRCIASLAGLCDEIICYDGAWEMFRGGRESSFDEYVAIKAGAADAAIPYTIYTPSHTWGSQVEKRAHLMLEAGETDADWILVIDGDEHLAECDDRAARHALTLTDRDVAQVMAVRTTGYDAVNVPGRIRRLYRATCGVTVETAHNGYRTQDGRWLHGDSAFVHLEPACDISAHVLMHHERLNRGERRNRAALDYRKARLETGVEAWRR